MAEVIPKIDDGNSSGQEMPCFYRTFTLSMHATYPSWFSFNYNYLQINHSCEFIRVWL